MVADVENLVRDRVVVRQRIAFAGEKSFAYVTLLQNLLVPGCCLSLN